MGLGPTFPAALFLETADLICPFDMARAFAAGTHYGYFRFASFFCFVLPHLAKLPSFLFELMSLQSCLNHFANPLWPDILDYL